MLPALLSIAPPVMAGGGSSSCSFTITNCLCTKTHFWIYNGGDNIKSIDASNYNLDGNANVTLSCNAGNCDTRFGYGGQTYWKNDHCGNIAAYPKALGGVHWIETNSTACPTQCPR
jgi:hypothetical protein